MSGPEWLRWIKPAPMDEEAVAKAVHEFSCVVGNIRLRRKDYDAARRAKAALRAIQALPCDLKERPEAMAFVQALEFRIHVIGEPPGNPSNRPHRIDKRVCIVFTHTWLRNRGSHISGGETGTLPNLAMAVWTAAGLNSGEESPKAWAQAWQRIRREQEALWFQIKGEHKGAEKPGSVPRSSG